MYRKYFDEVWKLHHEWGIGLLDREAVKLPTATVYLSDISGEYFNFATPTVSVPEQLDLESVRKVFEIQKIKPAFFLLEEHVVNGFSEYLIRKDFRFKGRDTWVGYDKNTYVNNQVNSSVTIVKLETFSDYSAVLGKVFSDFPGNPTYLEILMKSFSGHLNESFPDLSSAMYLIYEQDKPVGGAAMFYSKENNFAYLHDAGTLEEHRGKGYQSDLIKHRINIAIELGIDRIYSSIDHGGKSWSNTIKCGLNQMHTGQIFVLQD